MGLTYRTTVTVEAETASEAIAKANECHWDDDGMGAAELVDWEVRGAARPDGDL